MCGLYDDLMAQGFSGGDVEGAVTAIVVGGAAHSHPMAGTEELTAPVLTSLALDWLCFEVGLQILLATSYDDISLNMRGFKCVSRTSRAISARPVARTPATARRHVPPDS